MKNDAQSGFTIIEILIALGILIIGMVGVISLFTAGVGMYKRAADQNTAAVLAESIFADLDTDLTDVPPDPVYDQPSANFPQYHYDLEFASLDTRGFEILVKLTIRWQRGSKEHAKEFRTILLRK